MKHFGRQSHLWDGLAWASKDLDWLATLHMKPITFLLNWQYSYFLGILLSLLFWTPVHCLSLNCSLAFVSGWSPTPHSVQSVPEHTVIFRQFIRCSWLTFRLWWLNWNADHCVLQNWLLLSISPPFLRGTGLASFISWGLFLSLPLAQAEWPMISQSEKNC